MAQRKGYGTIKFFEGLDFWRTFMAYTLVATVGSFAIGIFPEEHGTFLLQHQNKALRAKISAAQKKRWAKVRNNAFRFWER